MIELIREEFPIAKKEHDCMASVWLNSDDWWRSSGELTISEFRDIIKARNDNWKIKIGEKYRMTIIKQDGELHTFRAKIPIDDICLKYDIYTE